MATSPKKPDLEVGGLLVHADLEIELVEAARLLEVAHLKVGDGQMRVAGGKVEMGGSRLSL
jgi:hypothetical protein